MGKKLQQPTADSELARREGNAIRVRATPLRVRFELKDLFTADNHQLCLGFSCCIRARPEQAERQMLEEALLTGREHCQAKDVVAYFMPVALETGRRMAAGRGVEECLSEDAKPELIEALRRALDAAAFAAGMEVLPPYRLEAESRSWRQMQRARVGRVAYPHPSEEETATLYAVAGPHLLRIGEEIEEIKISPGLGPYRSIQSLLLDEKTYLAIGAQRGVLLIDPTHPTETISFAVDDLSSPMGFNRVVVWGDEVWASHSEAGLVGWDWDNPNRPADRIPREKMVDGVRNLLAAGDRLLFSSAGQVFSMDSSHILYSVGDKGEPIVALLPAGDDILTIRSTGEIEAVDGNHRQHHAFRLSAAAMLPDSTRLLLATEDGPIHCVCIGDPAILQYPSSYRGLRALAAGVSQIAGISADRQRIVVFATDNSHPPITIPIAPHVRHRAADVAYVR